MPSAKDHFTLADFDELARLQTQLLPLSLISRLGYRYARAFYHFAACSPRELLLTERDGAHRIIAGCVVSLDIASLERRLLRSTPLLLAALLRLPWLLDTLRRGHAPKELNGAELVLLFTSPAARQRGSASRLIARAETELKSLGLTSYLVRTFDKPIDPTYRFYLARGFDRIQSFTVRGVHFVLMRKTISG
jgi:GNAT superfamily N-acetyltransferase